MLNTTFNSQRIINNHLRNDRSFIEELFGTKIEHWIQGNGTQASENVFVVAGWPGIGKTWLLKHVVQHINSNTRYLIQRRRCQAMYINWQDRFDSLRYRTAQAFVNEWKRQIAGIQVDKVCLCVDHIPPPPGDVGLQILENEVLFPALRDGAFLVVAQEHPTNWGLGARIPHRVCTLPPFSEQGIDQIFEQEGLTRDTRDLLVDYAAGHPFLARYLACEGLEKGVPAFLTYWLEQKNLTTPLEELLALALPLLQLESLDDREAAKSLGFSSRDYYEALRVLSANRAGWTEHHQREDGRFELRWIPPIKRCLDYLANRP